MTEHRNGFGSVERQCTSKKIAEPSRKAARRYAKKLETFFGTPYREYRCPICGRWHLSRRRLETDDAGS